MPENARLPRNIQGSFTCRKSTTWDFPSEGRRAEDFFALKNPTASVGFEPANLATKGQHATSRPPKPLIYILFIYIFVVTLLMFMESVRERDTLDVRNNGEIINEGK